MSDNEPRKRRGRPRTKVHVPVPRPSRALGALPEINRDHVAKIARDRRPFDLELRELPHDPRVHKLVLEEMAKGSSLTQVAAKLAVTCQTLLNWRARFEAFDELLEFGETLALAHWEDRLSKGVDSKEFNHGACAFAMKARFPRDYRDVQHHVHEPTNPLRDVIDAVRSGRQPEDVIELYAEEDDDEHEALPPPRSIN